MSLAKNPFEATKVETISTAKTAVKMFSNTNHTLGLTTSPDLGKFHVLEMRLRSCQLRANLVNLVVSNMDKAWF